MFRYNLNPDSEIPVYRQLVDQINAQIRSGALKTGTQLPTVREMAEQMNLSCGTVKRVYDCLREMGDIEMTRRRGTFVKYVRQDRDSRKLQAMTAIDRMIRSLSDLNFSPSEIQIFLNLKMREWGMKWSGIRIALVTAYPELAPAMEGQLAAIGNVKVIICSPQQVREYPYSIDEEADVILASPEDSQKLLPILPDRSKLIKVAFQLEAASVYALASRRAERMGVVCEGEAFVQLVGSFLPEAQLVPLRGDGLPDGIEAVVIPAGMDWNESMPAECIPFDYRIDAGSMIYLEERINRIRDERQIQPGMLRF